MSGTSLDGVDVVRVKFSVSESWEYTILEAHTHPYPKAWENRLSNAMHLSSQGIADLNTEYTTYLAELLDPYVHSSEYPVLDFVSSHGHTLFHQPEKGITLQIGNLPFLAQKLKVKVVCDYRVADVMLGGQGAPLVPGGEVHLFASYAACLNLGGFANITHLDQTSLRAYDICGVNIVLNFWAKKLGRPFDAGGELAKKGKLIPELKQRLDALAFYRQSPPKSLGKEWVQLEILPLMEEFSFEGIASLLHTYVLHSAEIIAAHLPKTGRTLVTGGGVYHTFLIESINQQSKHSMVIPSQVLVEFKEALIFAFLGVLRVRGEKNCLSSVTGAKHDHSSGKIFTI